MNSALTDLGGRVKANDRSPLVAREWAELKRDFISYGEFRVFVDEIIAEEKDRKVTSVSERSAFPDVVA